MTKLKQDESGHFLWPDPVVIDTIVERYQDVTEPADRTMIARLQAAALREICAGRPRPAALLRLELIAACAARGITPDRIARADLAVFWELNQIVSARFRTSPRLKASICAGLEAALDQLRDRPVQTMARPRGIVPAGAPLRWSITATG